MNRTVKAQVIDGMEVITQRVVKPNVFIEILYINEQGKVYYGSGFAKWNTDDMTTVAHAEREFNRCLNCGCDSCLMFAAECFHLMGKLDWNEDRGIAIATGRAVKQVVEQIEEKSKAGQITFEDFTNVSVAEFIEMNMR